MMKKIIATVILITCFLSGCLAENGQAQDESPDGIQASAFSINDLLIEGHEILGKCPFCNMGWDTLQANSPEITNTYTDSYPGTPDMQLLYSEGNGITYITDDNFIAGILLTDDTYSLGAGIRVGDELSQSLIDKYVLQYYGKSFAEGNATVLTGNERKSSRMLDYDSVFTGKAFVTLQENDLLLEDFLKNSSLSPDLFTSCEKGFLVSFYVREGIIVGICLEYIV